MIITPSVPFSQTLTTDNWKDTRWSVSALVFKLAAPQVPYGKIIKRWQNSHLSLAVLWNQSSPFCWQFLAHLNLTIWWISHLKGVINVLVDNCFLLAPLGNLMLRVWDYWQTWDLTLLIHQTDSLLVTVRTARTFTQSLQTWVVVLTIFWQVALYGPKKGT